MRALDLFAGPGGWSLACQRLGIDEDGIEIDDAARRTRDAAGFSTIHDDVATFPHVIGEYDLLIASPPCQTFSTAGKGDGRKALDAVLDAVFQIGSREAGDWPSYDDLSGIFGDERTALVVEPLKYALLMKPRFLAFEQVPTVLPVWEAYADVLRSHGWNVWTGNVNAEQYGVPQTRKRAILLADYEYEVAPPTPTHSRYHSRSPERMDEDVKPWVSMAEALGWGATTGHGGLPDNYGRRFGKAAMTREAFTELGQERTYTADVADDKPWTRERPATTIATRDLVPDPGANANRFNGATKSRNDGVRVSVQEAGILQSFPADFPWQGTKTKQFQQVGNAIPPLLAEAMLSTLLSSPDSVDTYQEEAPVTVTFEQPLARRGDPPRSGNGQYLIQVDPTRKAVGYSRVTNMVKPLDDTFHLSRWQVRTAARGFVSDPHLRDRLSACMDDDSDSNREANLICNDAHVAGGGNIGRDWGIAMHALTQQADAGQYPEHLSGKAAGDLGAYLQWRVANNVKVIASELVVVHDDVKVAGTFDRIYEIDGEWVIGDLKTGKHRDLGLPGYTAQMSWYARGLLYDYPEGCTCSRLQKADEACAVTHTRRPLTGVNTDKALIVWLPMGRAHCEAIWVDLNLGWEGAQIAAEALEWRKRAKAVEL